jgi:DNA-binding transcriptional LysR family regulator
MSLELVWLRTWIEVVDTGSFARAAEAIPLSQPRVSAHVANLERALGCTLIERRVRPLALTEDGRALLPKARAVLAAVDELASHRHSENQLSGLLKVASFASASSAFLPAVVRALRDRHPALEIGILDGDVQSLTFRPLWREPFVVLVPAGHPLLSEEAVALEQLASHRVITIGNPLQDSLGYEAEAALHASYVEVPMGTVSQQPTTLAAMVRAGLGIGVVNLLAAAMVRTDGLESRPILDLHRYRDVGVWWHSERPLPRASKAFIDLVVDSPIPHGTSPVPQNA